MKTILISILFGALFLAPDFYFLTPPAFSDENGVSVRLDLATLEKGYTVVSPHNRIAVSIPGRSLNKAVTVVVEEPFTTPEDAPLFPPPEGMSMKGGVYRYILSGVDPLDLTENVTLIITADKASESSQIMFYDRNQLLWRPLPTRLRSDGALMTATKMPFLQLGVFESNEPPALPTFKTPELSARAMIVADDHDRVLYSKNAYQPLPLASITKLMTALVFLEHNPGWDKIVTIRAADDAEPAKINLVPGDKVKVKDLFYAMLVGSKNNAAKALVRSTGLSNKKFVERMNMKAKQLGMLRTSFSDVTGLSEENQSSVQDTALLSWEAFKNTDITKATSLAKYVVKVQNSSKKHTIKTTNQLLGANASILNGKTGFTNEAGYNVAVRARRDGREVVVLVFGATDTTSRFEIAEKLVALAFKGSPPLAVID